LDSIYQSCDSKCEMRMKDDSICWRFCEFVSFIITSHKDELIELYLNDDKSLSAMV
jgi:hypothetical protein